MESLHLFNELTAKRFPSIQHCHRQTPYTTEPRHRRLDGTANELVRFLVRSPGGVRHGGGFAAGRADFVAVGEWRPGAAASACSSKARSGSLPGRVVVLANSSGPLSSVGRSHSMMGRHCKRSPCTFASFMSNSVSPRSTQRT